MNELLIEVVVLAWQEGPEITVGTGGGLAGGALSTFATTVVIGVLLTALAPKYTERMVEQVDDDPITSFLYGFVSLFVLGILIIALAITIIGLVIAIPLAVVVYILWAVGGTVAFLAISLRIVDRDDGWLKPILVAALLSGALVLSGIGGLVSLVVGAVGFGTVLMDLLG